MTLNEMCHFLLSKNWRVTKPLKDFSKQSLRQGVDKRERGGGVASHRGDKAINRIKDSKSVKKTKAVKNIKNFNETKNIKTVKNYKVFKNVNNINNCKNVKKISNLFKVFLAE